MFKSLDHAAIACFDVQKQAEWYCLNFGMRVLASNGAVPPAVVIGFGRSLVDGAVIELMPVRDSGAEPASVARFAPGMRHLAFGVDDFDAAYDRLKDIGVVFTTEIGQAVGGGKTILFRDPEGNELQIVQRIDSGV